MTRTPLMPRAFLPITAALLLVPSALYGEVPPHLVLLNGKAVPLAAVTMQGDNFVVKSATDEFSLGASIPVVTVDHVYGDKPVAINQAVALILTDNPDAGFKLLEPILAQHKDTAKLPGNFWLEAARSALVAKSATGFATATPELIKAISDATPAQGIDPISLLSKALTLPISTKVSERIDALSALTNDEMPADLCAYASFFKAELFKKDKRQDEALEAYLAVSSLYPTGGMVINGVAQFKAAEILTAKNRRDEALALINSSLRCVKGTAAEELATQLLQSIK